MSESNLPPGVTEGMIPGNRPEDSKYEKMLQEAKVQAIVVPEGWDPDRTKVVLSDGETYTEIRGCTFVEIPADFSEEEDYQEDEFIQDLLDIDLIEDLPRER